MQKKRLTKLVQRLACGTLSGLLLAGSLPATVSAASSEIWSGYPGVDQLPAVSTISNPFEFFDAANDPNGDGYVSTTAEWEARKLEIQDLVQRYWLGYRWPTQAEDVVGERKTMDDPNTISVGGYFGWGSTTLNLGEVFQQLMETLKTSDVEIRQITPAPGGWGADTLGDITTTIPQVSNPDDAVELEAAAIQAWNAGYYVPYTNWGSQVYAIMKTSTGEITDAPGLTKPVEHNVITITNPDTGVEASFYIDINMPTEAQIVAAWGSVDAKVPAIIEIGNVLSSTHIDELKEAGYAEIVFTPTTIYPDDSEASDGINRDGVYTTLYPYDKDKYEYASGALMAWGWAVSQIISALEQPTPEVDANGSSWGDVLGIDPTRTVVTGHSRNGKAAMFAAAFDERISVCMPSEPGGSGIQSYRYKVEGKIFGFDAYTKADRVYGKTEIPTVSYGKGNSWFPEQAANFLNKDNQLPFDSDEIIALVAPRPFLVTTGIDTHWLGNEGGVAAVQAAAEVYEYIGQNDTEKNNIAVRARQSDHVFYNRDFPFMLAVMDREFKQDNSDTMLHVQDLFPTDNGSLNGMSYPAQDYDNVSEFNAYPFDINSSYLPWSSANKYSLWTAQESFLSGHAVTIVAHSDAPDVDLYLPDGTTKLDATSHNDDAFTFTLTAEESVLGRYELRTNGNGKDQRNVFFSSMTLSDALRHAPSKGDEGEENRLIGFASRLSNTASDAPSVYIDGQKVTMNFTPNRFPDEETTLLEYGVQFHDKLFARIADGWSESKTFHVQNLKFVAMPEYTFEISLNDITASAANNGKDGAASFTKPISWNVSQFNNGPSSEWPLVPDTAAEKDVVNGGGTVTRPTAPAQTTTAFDTQVLSTNVTATSTHVNLTLSFNEALNKGQYGFGLDVAERWTTTWNDAGTQVVLSIAKSDITTTGTAGSLIIFRLMDLDENLIGGPVEVPFVLPAADGGEVPPQTPDTGATPTEPTVKVNADGGASNVEFRASQLPTGVAVSDVKLLAAQQDASGVPAKAAAATLAAAKDLPAVKGITVYDLGLLLKATGKEVSFTGSVKVILPIPSGYSNFLRVFHVADDGSMTEVPAVINGTNMELTLSHFSYYAIVDFASSAGQLPAVLKANGTTETAAPVTTPANGSNTEDTTKNPKTGAVAIPLLAVLLPAAGVLAFRRKK